MKKQLFLKTPALIVLLFLFAQCNNSGEDPQEIEPCEEETCCPDESASSETSEITCPHCGYHKTETLPTEVCMIIYNCDSCGTELTPQDGDCCVFCTYGTHKCPSKQE